MIVSYEVRSVRRSAVWKKTASFAASATCTVRPDSPDETRLYWVDSMLQRMWSLAIEAPGVVAPEVGHNSGDVLTNLPGLQWFDSLAVEAGGKVAAATLFNGGISVVDPGDMSVEHVPVPDPITTNIAFGGPDMRTAWITGSATGTLFKCRWPRPGLRLNFQQI